MKKNSHNSLINEKSTYLQQHAYNPVNWVPWSDAIIEKAKQQEKLLIISIGYSACHWCHVMEKESFEDIHVASLMNDNFICIKVDKEERPDIDMVYMEAVQLLTGQGGWPLNCIALPDGKPFYGGTYFNKKQWTYLLNQIVDLYKKDRKRLISQADKILQALTNNEFSNSQTISVINIDFIKSAVDKWKTTIDPIYGGNVGAPKFPMPAAINYLLHCQYLLKENTLLLAATNQLTKMYNGGIYDHLQGGFSRYSTDKKWFAPHFEKMLYDNAQLISSYAIAYLQTKNIAYKEIIEDSISFLTSELYCKNVGYFSSLDADSEGEEGKFYTWTYDEVRSLISDISFLDYFKIEKQGNWEQNKNIIHINSSIEEYCENNSIDSNSFKSKLIEYKKTLLNQRNKRTKPSLDSKILTSWNALTTIGLTHAYNALATNEYLEKATELGNLLLSNSLNNNYSLNRTMNYTSNSIDGFLDDYAFTIQAFIELYQATFDEKWLTTALEITNYTLNNFREKDNNLFYYCNNESNKLVAKKMELTDNVIPSSNSQMAINLYTLGVLFLNNDYINQAKNMCGHIIDYYKNSAGYYANWGKLINWIAREPIQLVVSGENAIDFKNKLSKNYLPNCIISGSTKKSKIPILKGKFLEDKTGIYICKGNTCLNTIYSAEEAIVELQKII